MSRLAERQAFLHETLAMKAFEHYQRTHDEADLRQAVSGLERALMLLPADSTHRARVFEHLARVRFEHFERTQSLADLDHVVDLYSKARHGTPEASPRHPGTLSNLIFALVLRAERRVGDAATRDRDAAIDLGVRYSGSPSLHPMVSAQVAAALDLRYDRDGHIEDLYAAVDLYQQTLARLPSHGSDRAGITGAVGGCLMKLAVRTARRAEWDRAVEWQEAAVALTPRNDPRRAVAKAGLGRTLLGRWSNSAGDTRDLDHAFKLLMEASEAGAPSSFERRYLSATLGLAHLHRATQPEGTSADLDAAVGQLEQAMAQSREALDAGLRMGNLAQALLARSERHSTSGDLDRAISLLEQLQAEQPPSPSPRAVTLTVLGHALQLRWRRANDPRDRDRATRVYQQVSDLGPQVAPDLVLTASSALGDLEAGAEAWTSATSAYRRGLDALRELYQVQLRRAHRESTLRAAAGLPVRAAHAAVRAGRPQAAVVALEEGRAVMLSEALERIQTDLSRLMASGREDLAERYQQAAMRLVELDRAELGILNAPPGLSVGHIAHERAAARAAFDTVVGQIRAVLHPEPFLDPPTFADVDQAAQLCPLVYLTAAAGEGLALIVRKDEQAPETLATTTIVPLPQLTEEAVDKAVLTLQIAHHRSKTTRRGKLDKVTGWLWEAAMRDVVGALGNTRAVTLIPVGRLGLLPLHAAWTPDKQTPSGRRYALDDVTLRYAPNARALLSAHLLAERVTADRLLAVANPQPGTFERPNDELEYAGPEAIIAAHHFDPAQPVLSREQAKLDEVARLLPTSPVHHLACHGVARLDQPLDSALRLADGELRLRDILQIPIDGSDPPGTRLSILSACETQLPGDDLPDEVISLPSGLLQAGVAGVVASQWAVDDHPTAILMARFYAEWKAAGRSCAEALRAAQRWTRDSTNEDKAIFLQNITSATPELQGAGQILREELDRLPRDAHSFEHPTDWAAFAYVGA
jgi:CHAT domain-containing protein/tetratricopeptide (TPR) repeat protein